MPNHSRLIKIGLLTFVIGLVVSFPARVAYRWFVPPELKFSGISGSVWSGKAIEASANGVYLRDLSWRIRPTELLGAKLGYAVKSRLAAGSAEGDIAFGLGATVVAEDLTLSLPLEVLQGIPSFAGSRGNLLANFSELRIEAGLPVAAEGVINISNLVVEKVHRDSLGAFEAEFFTQEAGVMASVEDTDAIVDFAGTLQILADRSFQFLGLVSATTETPAQLRQQMQNLGSANERGQYEVRAEGQL